jgi:hypothetical protein
MSGPYETERDAQDAAHRWPVGGTANENPNLTMLLDALLGTDVALGAYDRRIVEWLAQWEPATCAVVAGLITRAHAAGQDTAGGPGTAQPGGGWISGPST